MSIVPNLAIVLLITRSISSFLDTSQGRANTFTPLFCNLVAVFVHCSMFLDVYSVKISPRRIRNIFLNSIILVIGIFTWHFMLFSSVNLAGTLAVSIAILLLAVVIWFMYLVTHRYGGYLFSAVVVWHLFQLYLSIALVVKN